MTSTLSTVKDKSTAWLTVRFYDKDGALEVPTSIDWTVVDVASGTVMLAKTAVGTPANTVELTLTSAINTIQDSTKENEKRRVTVEAGFSGNELQTQEYEYLVENLEEVPIPDP